MEVNERHERAALIELLEGERGTDFLLEALDQGEAALRKLADSMAAALEQQTLLAEAVLGSNLREAVTEYIRSCPAFESAVERAEQDDREAAADAKYDARRDDALNGVSIP